MVFLPYFGNVGDVSNPGISAKIQRTLERIDIKALVVPVESFFFECPLKRVPLRLVRRDNLVGDALFILEVFRDECDGLDFFSILMTQSAPIPFNATATLTIRLVPFC